MKHINLGFYYPCSVALNFQTAGEGMDLNDGLFSQNGRCGYILKPIFMRDGEQKFDPETPQKQDGHQPCVLTVQVQKTQRKKCIPEVISVGLTENIVWLFICIQVISGQQFPKVNIKEGSIVDPLVRVEIHGVPMDQAKQETRYIENNGTLKTLA